MPRVSLGVPVYNGERFLETSLRSLLDQTYQDFELIVSDNASKDRTREICQDLAATDSRISYSRSEINQGAARNFNRTFELSSGEYFKWAACDDLCGPRFLELCVDQLDQDPSLALCHTKTIEIDVDGNPGPPYEFDMRTEDERPHIRFADLVAVLHPSTLVFGVMRSSMLKRTGLIGPFVSSDRVLLSEIGLCGKLRELEDPLFLRRVHDDNSIMLNKRSTLLEWYDPKRRGDVSMPYWRLLTEYVRVTKRHDLSAAERAKCLLALGGYLKVRGRELTADLNHATRCYGRRLFNLGRVSDSRALSRSRR